MPVDQDLQERANRANSRHAALVSSIRQDPTTTAHGKKLALARVQQQHITEMTALGTEHMSRFERRLADSEKKVFSVTAIPGYDRALPDERLAMDAAFRAARRAVESVSDMPTATQRLAQAMRAGDEAEIRALVAVAADRGWQGTIEALRSSRPGTAAEVDAYWRAASPEERKAAAWEGQMTFSRNRPSELRDDFEVARLAAVADGTPAA